MRRENERLLQDHIDEFMEDAKEHIDDCSVIILHAPGMNKNVFMSEGIWNIIFKDCLKTLTICQCAEPNKKQTVHFSMAKLTLYPSKETYKNI